MHSLRTSEDTSARQYGGNFLAQRSFSCGNAADPLRNKARILPRCHAVFGTTACEQELARIFVGNFQIIIDTWASETLARVSRSESDPIAEMACVKAIAEKLQS
jgi:hypothetical protein